MAQLKYKSLPIANSFPEKPSKKSWSISSVVLACLAIGAVLLWATSNHCSGRMSESAGSDYATSIGWDGNLPSIDVENDSFLAVPDAVSVVQYGGAVLEVRFNFSSSFIPSVLASWEVFSNDAAALSYTNFNVSILAKTNQLLVNLSSPEIGWPRDRRVRVVANITLPASSKPSFDVEGGVVAVIVEGPANLESFHSDTSAGSSVLHNIDLSRDIRIEGRAGSVVLQNVATLSAISLNFDASSIFLDRVEAVTINSTVKSGVVKADSISALAQNYFSASGMIAVSNVSGFTHLTAVAHAGSVKVTGASFLKKANSEAILESGFGSVHGEFLGFRGYFEASSNFGGVSVHGNAADIVKKKTGKGFNGNVGKGGDSVVKASTRFGGVSLLFNVDN